MNGYAVEYAIKTSRRRVGHEQPRSHVSVCGCIVWSVVSFSGVKVLSFMLLPSDRRRHIHTLATSAIRSRYYQHAESYLPSRHLILGSSPSHGIIPCSPSNILLSLRRVHARHRQRSRQATEEKVSLTVSIVLGPWIADLSIRRTDGAYIVRCKDGKDLPLQAARKFKLNAKLGKQCLVKR
jgi:hypothetical protein